MKRFCYAKDKVKRMKRQAINWEKILAKDTTYKGLLFKTYKELLKLKVNK